MKNTILFILSLSLFSCTPYYSSKGSIEPSYKTVRARITYYHCYQDKWGCRVSDPKTKKAIQGITIAAHPDFVFGTKLFIPELTNIHGDGNFIVQDRGNDVTKKKASKGKGYVFDVYCNNVKTYNKMRKNNPEWMEVRVYE